MKKHALLFFSLILPWTQVIKIAGDVAYVARIVVNAGGCWQVQSPKEEIVVGIVVVFIIVFIPSSFFSLIYLEKPHPSLYSRLPGQITHLSPIVKFYI